MKKSEIPTRQFQTSNYEFFDLLERITDGVVAFDTQMNYTYVNKRGGELLGRTPEDLIGKNYWKEYPEAKGTPFANAYVKALETRETIVIEDYYPPWDRWFENRIYPSKDGLSIFFTEITERKRKEEALRSSEERYRVLAEAAHDMIFVVDREMRIEYSNTYAAHQVGRKQDELIGIKFTDLFPSQVHSRQLANVQRVIDSREPLYVEAPTGRTEGIIWQATWLSPLFDSADHVRAVMGITRDITERKRVEEALVASQQTLQALFDTMAEGVALNEVVYDQHGEVVDYRIVQVNREFYSTADYVGTEVVGNVATRLYGMSSDFIKAWWREHRAKNTTVYSEYWSPLRNKCFYIGTSPIVNDIFVTSFIDITERKRNEATIRQQLSEISSYYDNAPIGLAILDTDLRFLRINTMLASINGIPTAAHVGKTVREIVPALEEQARQVTAEILRTGKAVVDIEFKGETAAQPGVMHTWLEGWHPMRDDAQKITGFIVIVQDITARKQAEEALRESEARYKATTSHPDLVLAQTDLDLRYTWIRNPHPDFDPKMLLNKRDDELADNEGARQLVQLKREVIETGKGVRRDITFPVSDGPRTYSFAAEPLRDNAGNVTGVATAALDITERKRTEEAHHRSEEKFSIIFKKGPYAAALVNVSDRVIEDVNEEHERLFELSREEFVGKTPEMLNMVIDAEQRKRIADLIREHGFVANEQLTIQLRSGKKIDILLNVNSVQIDGKTYLLTIAKDITEISQKEEQLRALTAHLQTAIEQERDRIAREIHDDIGQIFTAIKLRKRKTCTLLVKPLILLGCFVFFREEKLTLLLWTSICRDGAESKLCRISESVFPRLKR